MPLKKYEGDRTPKSEATYIEINRLKSEIAKIKKKTLVRSGAADFRIQALPTGKQKNKSVGKYFARPIGLTTEGSIRNQMEENPLDILNTRLQILDKNRLMASPQAAEGFDVNQHQARLLSTGPFKDANTRASIWNRLAVANGMQVQVAQMTTNQQELMDASIADLGGKPLIGKGVPSPVGKRDSSGEILSKHTGRSVKEQDALRAKEHETLRKPDELLDNSEAAMRKRHPEMY